MKKFLKIVFIIVVGLLLIQLIPVDRTRKPIDKKLQFETVENTPPKIVNLMKKACYDCHSLETKYPDHASIAPISWVISGHVSDARKEVNFSLWKNYNPDLQRSMLQNTIDALESGHMPKHSYVNYHPEANITNAQRKLLVDYFKKVLDSGSNRMN